MAQGWMAAASPAQSTDSGYLSASAPVTCSEKVTEVTAQSVFAADINRKNKQHRHNMNCMYNLANISIKVLNDLSCHGCTEISRTQLRSAITWGVFCSSITHTDPLKNLQGGKSYSLSLRIFQKLNCLQKSRWEALCIISYHLYMWLTFWLFPSFSSLISLH